MTAAISAWRAESWDLDIPTIRFYRIELNPFIRYPILDQSFQLWTKL